ncbi:MAG: GTP-binding protein [Promethearchaeota archaeon]
MDLNTINKIIFLIIFAQNNIMKVVVSGPLGSGKSSYIRFLDPKALNIEAESRQFNCKTTVAMDMGIIKLNGFDVFLFGTPGLLHFSVMRDIVASGADGVIFIFDASQPEKDEDAIIILNSIRKLLEPNTPIVYLANKQDIKNVRSPEVIRAQNSLPKEAKIFPSNTRTGLNVMESLKYLVNEIYDNYSELLHVLRMYQDDIKGLAKRLKKNKEQMRDFLNNLEIKRFIELDRINQCYKVREGLKNLI